MIVYTQPARIATLQRQPYFDNVPERVLNILQAEMTLRTFPAKSMLFFQGDEPAGLYIVESGNIKLYRTSRAGRNIIIRIVGSGESFNEVPVFDGGRNAVNAMALSHSKVWVVPAHTIRQQIQSCPQLAQTVIHALSQNTRKLVDKLVVFSLQRINARLAKLILDLPPESISGADRLSQDDMAACLGTVREVMARSLRYLQEQGAIEIQRGHIKVLDPVVLQRLAEDTGD